MRKPRIGIPLTLDDRERWRADREYHYIDRSYADAIDRAGGIPLHLPLQSDPREVAKELDGLLLPGGDDFPSPTPLPEGIELDLVPAEQLVFDESILAAANERGIPVLGICYGMQLMVRADGGTLDAHLPSQRPGSIEHRLPDQGRHSIEIASQSRLAALLGDAERDVNSLHHQGVRSLGPNTRAVAHGSDGLIEAIEWVSEDSSTFRIGVQWHPEKMNDPANHRLFEGLVAACRERMS